MNDYPWLCMTMHDYAWLIDSVPHHGPLRSHFGRKISHTPNFSRQNIGCARLSQKLKSPTKLTECALGAQTAKRVPHSPGRNPCLCFPRIVASSHRMQTGNGCDNFDLYRTFLAFERAPGKHEHYWTSLDQGALLDWQVLACECGAPCDERQTSCWDDAIPLLWAWMVWSQHVSTPMGDSIWDEYIDLLRGKFRSPDRRCPHVPTIYNAKLAPGKTQPQMAPYLHYPPLQTAARSMDAGGVSVIPWAQPVRKDSGSKGPSQSKKSLSCIGPVILRRWDCVT